MSNLRQKLVAVAAGELGVKESNGGDDKYIKWYNSVMGTNFAMNVAWCAIFVSWCARQAGISTDLIPNYASCTYGGIAGFKERGTYHTRQGYTPKPGDVVFYNWDNDSASEHTGIVETVSGTAMTVIEGNYNDAVKRRNISIGSSLIMGYGCWDGDTTSSVEPVTIGTTVRDLQTALNAQFRAGLAVDNIKGRLTTAAMAKCVLRKGMRGAAVCWVQLRLIALGYSCGSCGADGIFGAATLAAIKCFQADKRIAVDGEVGVQTYSALLVD